MVKWMTLQKNRLLMLGLLLILLISAVMLSLACCSTTNDLQNPAAQAKLPDYAGLEERWNEYADVYPAKYRLYGDRGGSDENILAALNSWLKAFAAPLDARYVDELEKMRNKYGETTFHAWDDFRKAHHRQNSLELSKGMSPAEIAETINNYIGVSEPQNPQDYISRETVRTVIYMNSLCAFFEGEKSALYKRGIDTKFHECGELTSNGEYPALDALLH